MTKVSVIIPTKNSAVTLGRCLDSIINQSFSDWEVLLMDAVSSDDTLKIGESYHDSRIHIYSEPDKGIYDAMNKGILKSGGEWLYFLGSDDYLIDEQVLYSFFSDSDYSEYDVVYGDVESEFLDDNYYGEWNYQKILMNRCHQAVFYKSDLFGKMGLYNLRYPILADFDFNLKWFFNDSVKKRYVDRKIARFSENGVSSRSVDPYMERDIGLLIFCRGRHVLDISQKRSWMKMYIARNQDSGPKRFFFSIVLYYLTVVNYLHEKRR